MERIEIYHIMNGGFLYTMGYPNYEEAVKAKHEIERFVEEQKYTTHFDLKIVKFEESEEQC